MFWRQVVSHSPTRSDELSHARGRGSPYLRHLDELNGLIDRGGSLSGNERNCVFLNLGPKPNKKRFATASTVTGLDQADDTRCYGLTDWDHDGDVDLWAMNRTGPRVRVMLNQQSTLNHFLSLKLVGRTCNTDAIGARVEVVGNATESMPMTKSLRAGEGFLSQSTKWLHFGLGRSDAIHAVTVHWPGGVPERFEGLAVDHQYELVQGAGVPLRLSTKANGFPVNVKLCRRKPAPAVHGCLTAR